MPIARKSETIPPLTVNPTEIVLARDPTGNRGAFTIRNNESSLLAFKIKSTNPDAFKLEPFHGVLKEKESLDIQVTLLPGTKCDNHERFLVLTSVTDQENLTSEEIHELFEDASTTISQYLARIILRYEANRRNVESRCTVEDMLESMEQLITVSMKMQVAILVFVCFLFIIFS